MEVKLLSHGLNFELLLINKIPRSVSGIFLSPKDPIGPSEELT